MRVFGLQLRVRGWFRFGADEPVDTLGLLLAVDTLRADHAGAVAATGPLTPALDAVARDVRDPEHQVVGHEGREPRERSRAEVGRAVRPR